MTSCLSDEEMTQWKQALHDDAFTQAKLELLQEGKSVRDFTMDSTGLLYFQPKQQSRRLVVPASERQRVMAEHHDAKTARHCGIEWTRELIQRDFWWKGMRQDIAH